MRGSRLIGLTFLMVTLLAGCGASKKSPAITLRDDTGHVIHLSGAAERIIPLGPSNTEILLALGLKKDIVGVDQESLQYLPPPYAGHLGGIPVVGNSLTGLNVEKIAGLKPNLILAVPGTADLKELEALKIPVAILLPNSLSGVYHDIALVGQATGNAAGAQKEIARMRGQVLAVQRAVAKISSRPTVFVELGASPYYTAGPGSFIDALVRTAGGVNVVDRITKAAWPALSSEAVIAANPDVIVLDDTPYASAASVSARPGWNTVTAVRRHDVIANINPDYLSQPSPAILIGLQMLAKDLHPGLHIH